MKRLTIICGIALLLMSACAKDVEKKENSAKTYFDAWVAVNCPDAQKTKSGVYILEDQEGSGAQVGTEGSYIRLNFTTRELDGKVTSTTYESLAKQLGTYSENSYYGPRIFDRKISTLQLGVEEAMATMKVGGKRKVVIPGWLLTSARYDTIDEYIANSSGKNSIYEIEIVDLIEDIDKWQIDSIASYLSHNHPTVGVADSLKTGFYYIQEQAPTGQFKSDTTVYINYVGRLLDGRVFDTNIRDTAIVYGLYKSSRTYEPSQINWKKEDYKEITMGSSTVVDGFAYGLHQMNIGEKGKMIFYSPLGYGNQAQNAIPEFSPLIFEVKLVDKAI